MSTAEKKTRYSYEEYLALEKKAEYKSEYYQGEIFAMSGGTRNHSIIGTNINSELRSALMGHDCFVFSSDLQIRIEEADVGVYPDGMVICGQEHYYEEKTHIVTNPTVVIEVLSDSTGAWDYRGKFRQYELLPSLKEYVLLEQKEAKVDVFRRNDQGFWVLERYSGLEAMVEFQSLNVAVPMKGIYYGVKFPA